MAFQDDMTVLELKKQAHQIRGQQAKVEQERLKADREEVKVQRYETQLQAEQVRLEGDRVMLEGENIALNLKRVGVQSIQADLDFQTQRLALKQERYGYEIEELRAETQQRLQQAQDVIDGVFV